MDDDTLPTSHPCSSTSPHRQILELENNPSDHPFYVAAQFHPEFKSRWVHMGHAWLLRARGSAWGSSSSCQVGGLGVWASLLRGLACLLDTSSPLPLWPPPTHPCRPGKPSPLFLGFVLASGKRLDGYLRSRDFPKSPLKAPPGSAQV